MVPPIWKLSPSCSKVVSKLSQSCHKVVLNLSQAYPKLVPQLSPGCPKIVLNSKYVSKLFLSCLKSFPILTSNCLKVLPNRFGYIVMRIYKLMSSPPPSTPPLYNCGNRNGFCKSWLNQKVLHPPTDRQLPENLTSDWPHTEKPVTTDQLPVAPQNWVGQFPLLLGKQSTVC